MEAESRKRGRETETRERSESDRVAKKLDADGCRGGGGEGEEEEEEMGRGVFDFPWLKGEGVMTEEEWKEAAEGEDTFLGSLGRCCGETEEEEVGMEGGGMRLPEETTSTLTSEDLEDGVSLELELEESWDRDGIWASLLH